MTQIISKWTESVLCKGYACVKLCLLKTNVAENSLSTSSIMLLFHLGVHLWAQYNITYGGALKHPNSHFKQLPSKGTGIQFVLLGKKDKNRVFASRFGEGRILS